VSQQRVSTLCHSGSRLRGVSLPAAEAEAAAAAVAVAWRRTGGAPACVYACDVIERVSRWLGFTLNFCVNETLKTFSLGVGNADR
jgi:hypothetical protein